MWYAVTGAATMRRPSSARCFLLLYSRPALSFQSRTLSEANSKRLPFAIDSNTSDTPHRILTVHMCTFCCCCASVSAPRADLSETTLSETTSLTPVLLRDLRFILHHFIMGARDGERRLSSNSQDYRSQVAALKAAGCDPDMDSVTYLNVAQAGDFESCVQFSGETAPGDPFVLPRPTRRKQGPKA